jgi:predicted nucleic acid-binding protein
MPIFFLDSSAIAKRYVAETGSAWVAGVMHPSAGNHLQVARISGVEVIAAIA